MYRSELLRSRVVILQNCGGGGGVDDYRSAYPNWTLVIRTQYTCTRARTHTHTHPYTHAHVRYDIVYSTPDRNWNETRFDHAFCVALLSVRVTTVANIIIALCTTTEITQVLLLLLLLFIYLFFCHLNFWPDVDKDACWLVCSCPSLRYPSIYVFLRENPVRFSGSLHVIHVRHAHLRVSLRDIVVPGLASFVHTCLCEFCASSFVTYDLLF